MNEVKFAEFLIVTKQNVVESELINLKSIQSVQPITPAAVAAFESKSSIDDMLEKDGIGGIAEALLGKEEVKKAKEKATEDRDRKLAQLRMTKSMINGIKGNSWLCAESIEAIRDKLKAVGAI